MNRPAPWRSIMDSVVDRGPFRVGRATVDPISRDARWQGGEERLQPQTLKVLLTLVSHRGEVVTRDDLIQLCWDGRIVGDDVINRSISLLRHFAERAGGFEIETVPRTGYRLVESDTSSPSKTKHLWMAAAIALSFGIVGVGGWTKLDRQPVSQGVPPTPSISIIPFTAEGKDLVAQQVAEAAPVSIEHMMAESGFASMRNDPVATNAAPSDYVFTGDIRRTQSSVDATVQLVSRRDGTIAYAHDFSAPIDRAADLPGRIGATVVTETGWAGAAMILDPREHLGPQIKSEMMSAMTLVMEEEGGLRAYQLVRHAATLAPDSAFPQLSLAMLTPQRNFIDSAEGARRSAGTWSARQ